MLSADPFPINIDSLLIESNSLVLSRRLKEMAEPTLKLEVVFHG